MAETHPGRYTAEAGVFLTGIQLPGGGPGARPASPAAGEAGTAEGAHEAGTHAHPPQRPGKPGGSKPLPRRTRLTPKGSLP